jgi:hypothetical protein
MTKRITEAELREIAAAVGEGPRDEHPMPARLRDVRAYDDYGHDDIVRALVAEVRRLRSLIAISHLGNCPRRSDQVHCWWCGVDLAIMGVATHANCPWPELEKEARAIYADGWGSPEIPVQAEAKAIDEESKPAVE